MRVSLLFLLAIVAHATAVSFSAGAALRPGAVAAGGSFDLFGRPGNQRPPFGFDFNPGRPGRPGGPPRPRPPHHHQRPHPPFGQPPFLWPGFPFDTTTTASPSTSTTTSTSTTNSASSTASTTNSDSSTSTTSSGSTASTSPTSTQSSTTTGVTSRMGEDLVNRIARDIRRVSNTLFPSRVPRQSSLFGSPFIPNIDDFISNILNSSNSRQAENSNSSSNSQEPLQLPQLPSFPIMSEAVQYARKHLLTALGSGGDLASGLNRAINEASISEDPQAATRTLLRTVVDAYVTVAVNCPVFIIGSAVIQEGTQLAMEIARRLSNISIEGGISVNV